MKIGGLEEFQRQVTSFLEKAIDKRYEHYYQSAKTKTAENQRLTSFLLNKTQFYVERTDEFELLFDFLSKDPKKLSLIRGDNAGKENSTDQNEKQPILALKGRSGEGKTSLLAKFVLHIEVNRMITKSSANRWFSLSQGNDERSFSALLSFSRRRTSAEFQQRGDDERCRKNLQTSRSVDETKINKETDFDF